MYPKEQFYATILGIRPPWEVTVVELREKPEEVHVTVATRGAATHACPKCRRACPGYDTRTRLLVGRDRQFLPIAEYPSELESQVEPLAKQFFESFRLQ